MVVILRVQDFCFVHVIKVEIFFFSPRAYIFFGQSPQEYYFVINNSRGKWFFFLLLPHPSLHFSTGPSLNQLLF